MRRHCLTTTFPLVLWELQGGGIKKAQNWIREKTAGPLGWGPKLGGVVGSVPPTCAPDAARFM